MAYCFVYANGRTGFIQTIEFLISTANEGVSSKAVIHRAYWTQHPVKTSLPNEADGHSLIEGCGAEEETTDDFCVSVKP